MIGDRMWLCTANAEATGSRPAPAHRGDTPGSGKATSASGSGSGSAGRGDAGAFAWGGVSAARHRVRLALAAALLTAALGDARVARAEPPAPEQAGVAALEEAVRLREQAFARTMADRDHAAFTTFLAEDAVFVGRTVLRGRSAVAQGWKPYFEGDRAPFSWAPDRVAVVESGRLALSSGPVQAPDGTRIGTFVSTWRLDADGQWRIVLDTGCPPCTTP